MERLKTWHSFGIATGLAFSLATGILFFLNLTVSVVFNFVFLVLLKTTLKIRRHEVRAELDDPN
jgi:hypothetical protein